MYYFIVNIYSGQNSITFEFDDYDDALPFAITALNECTEECEITITFRKKED